MTQDHILLEKKKQIKITQDHILPEKKKITQYHIYSKSFELEYKLQGNRILNDLCYKKPISRTEDHISNTNTNTTKYFLILSHAT